MADLTREQAKGLELIGQLISSERDQLIRLLESYGWSLDPAISAKTLTGAILETLEHAGKAFSKDLTGLLNPESNFSPPQQGVRSGAGPISAISGAIGSVANLVQSLTNRKEIKRQAQSATLTALLQARTPKRIVYSTPQPKRKVWPWIVGGVFLLGSAALFIYLNSQSQ